MERLNSQKFTKISNEQLKVILGGAGTRGGSEQNGQPVYLYRNGVCVSVTTPMRRWSSDERDENGNTCYNDEEFYNDVSGC